MQKGYCEKLYFFGGKKGTKHEDERKLQLIQRVSQILSKAATISYLMAIKLQ